MILWQNRLICGFQGSLLKSAVTKQEIESMMEDADFMPYSWHREVGQAYDDVMCTIREVIQQIRELRGWENEQ